jgi:hypothetical protein
MRVKGSEVTRRDVVVDVDAGQVLQQIRADLYRSVGMPTDAYLNHRGHLVEDEDYGHGSPSQKLITETPTENQVKTIEAFVHIYAMMIRD